MQRRKGLSIVHTQETSLLPAKHACIASTKRVRHWQLQASQRKPLTSTTNACISTASWAIPVQASSRHVMLRCCNS
jgi:hypothetical protein